MRKATDRDRLSPQKDIFRDIEVVNHAEFLVDHRDSAFLRCPRAVEHDRFTPQAHFARVGPHDAPEDIHESGLPRAVVPYDGMHGALVEAQADMIEGLNAAKGLADIFNFKQEITGLGHGPILLVVAWSARRHLQGTPALRTLQTAHHTTRGLEARPPAVNRDARDPGIGRQRGIHRAEGEPMPGRVLRLPRSG